MRVWIDGFYQDNQVLLNKWNQVEQNIISFINSTNQPLRNLKNWIDKSEELWKELRLVAKTIVKFGKLEKDATVYKSLINNLNASSRRYDRILSNCHTRLKRIYNKRERYQLAQVHLETFVDRLKMIYGSTEIYSEFLLIVRKPIASQALEILERTAQLIKQQKNNLKFISLENQLFQWWGNIRRHIPSLNKFKKAYKNNQSNKDIKSKYNDFIKSVFELPFSDTPEIFLKKAKFLSDEWGLDFSEYSLQLTVFFAELHTSVPQWINGTNLTISDLIPFQRQDRINFGVILTEIGDAHPINKMIKEKMTIEQKRQREILMLETERRVLQLRDEALIELINLKEQPLDISTEEREAYLDCLRDMYNLRNEIELELIDLANSIHSPDKFPRLVEPKDIQEFLKLLNEYKKSVSNFVYPYKQDRKVQEVNLTDPFPEIFELELREDQLNVSKTRPIKLQIELEQTIPDSQAGVNVLQDIREMSYTITPKARLAKEISKIKPNSNISENLEEALSELNDNEFRVVSKSIAKLDTVIQSRREILDVILAIVGLLPDRELAIHRQYANRPINLEVTTMTEQSKNVEVEMIFNAPVTGATGKNDGTININISEQRQTLAEAANEIQQLLKHLEKTNPSATEPEQAAYIDLSVQPSLKQRTIAALRTGGETAIDEFFLENKYLKVGKAVVKAWLQPTS